MGIGIFSCLIKTMVEMAIKSGDSQIYICLTLVLADIHQLDCNQPVSEKDEMHNYGGRCKDIKLVMVSEAKKSFFLKEK